MRGGIFMVVFAIAWTAIVLVFDVTIAREIIGQIRSKDFPTTDGTILTSKVEEKVSHDPEDGTSYSYHVNVSFSYSVDGRNYTGSRFRYQSAGTSDRSWGDEVV